MRKKLQDPQEWERYLNKTFPELRTLEMRKQCEHEQDTNTKEDPALTSPAGKVWHTSRDQL